MVRILGYVDRTHAVMKSRSIKVQCEGGLHLRVAARIAQAVQQCQSAVHLRCEGCPWANGCSIMEILKLGARHGTPLEVQVEGVDEENTLQTLAGLLDRDGAG